MNLNSNLISILALGGALFFAGMTISGNRLRAKLLKEQLGNAAIEDKLDI